MAANIDQIFQEFILNKIREIEVQNEDKTYVTSLFGIPATESELCLLREIIQCKNLIVVAPSFRSR